MAVMKTKDIMQLTTMATKVGVDVGLVSIGMLLLEGVGLRLELGLEMGRVVLGAKSDREIGLVDVDAGVVTVVNRRFEVEIGILVSWAVFGLERRNVGMDIDLAVDLIVKPMELNFNAEVVLDWKSVSC